MTLTHNPVGWFEIPTLDLDRAISFYEEVFGFELKKVDLGNLQMAWFPQFDGEKGSTGALVYNPDFYVPSEKGTLVYFTSPSGDLDQEIEKVKTAGGEIVVEKRQISEEYGYMFIMKDSEGNRIAVHSR